MSIDRSHFLTDASTGLVADDLETLARAAELVSGKWEFTVARQLEASFVETASHSSRAGVTSRQNWIASLHALGKVCLAIAEREKRKDDR
jgi:hypothetical protein